jgi:hypothetical protein
MEAFNRLQVNRSVRGGTTTMSRGDERRQVEIEESLETLSRYLDGLFRIPGVGWRFGLDSLIGLIPGAGDTATTLVSFYILAAAVRYRVPKVTILRMALNIAIDYLVGAIPFVGDLFDFVWKSNKMNMDLLRERATVSAADAKRGRTSDWIFVGGIMIGLLFILFSSIYVSYLILSTIFQQLWQIF